MRGDNGKLGTARSEGRGALASIIAAIGIFGGICSIATGVICVVVHAALRGDSAFGQVGTALLIAGTPMLLVGSIFLEGSE